MAKHKPSKTLELGRRNLLAGSLSLPALGFQPDADTEESIDPRLTSFVAALLPLGAGAIADQVRTSAARLLATLLRSEGEQAQALLSGYLIFALCWTPKVQKQAARGAQQLLSRLYGDAKHRPALDAAFDVAYAAFSEVDGLDQALWGNAYARRGEACVYWDRYDKKP